MSLEANVSDFLAKNNVIAVVGVSRNPEKYGNKVFFDLLEAGYKVYAIHRDGGAIGEHKRYPDLASLPETPDVVNVVVPSVVTEGIVRECKERGITKVWMQPGSESRQAIDFCQENGIAVLHGVCIMIEKAEKLRTAQ